MLPCVVGRLMFLMFDVLMLYNQQSVITLHSPSVHFRNDINFIRGVPAFTAFGDRYQQERGGAGYSFDLYFFIAMPWKQQGYFFGSTNQLFPP
jgi:hypothetical protein